MSPVRSAVLAICGPFSPMIIELKSVITSLLASQLVSPSVRRYVGPLVRTSIAIIAGPELRSMKGITFSTPKTPHWPHQHMFCDFQKFVGEKKKPTSAKKLIFSQKSPIFIITALVGIKWIEKYVSFLKDA